jgi:hypothetical protein
MLAAGEDEHSLSASWRWSIMHLTTLMDEENNIMMKEEREEQVAAQRRNRE